MSGLMPRSSQNQDEPQQRFISLRALSILLMVVGVICFVAARLLFGEQVLCLLGSTVITFVGLGLIVASRRYGWENGRSEHDVRKPYQEQRSQVGPVRRSSQQVGMPVQRPIHSTVDSQSTEEFSGEDLLAGAVNADPSLSSLLDQVIGVLEQQGAQVRLEVQRDDRSILRVTTSVGRSITMMVRDDAETVDVADVRALSALVSSSFTEAGFLVSAGPITDRAYEWASARQIHLVAADEIDELGV